jgi:hypothetical protein
MSNQPLPGRVEQTLLAPEPHKRSVRRRLRVLQHGQRVIQLQVDSYHGEYPLCTAANTRLMLPAQDLESVINVFNAVVEESQLSHRLRATV